MTTEHTFARSIHRALKAHKEIYAWKINDNFADGVADAYYSGSKGRIFIEYKYVKNVPKRDGTLIMLTNEKQYLSAGQKKWLKTQVAHKSRVAVIVGSPKGMIICPQLTWENAIPAKYLRNRGNYNNVAQWLLAQCTYKKRTDTQHEKFYHPNYHQCRSPDSEKANPTMERI